MKILIDTNILISAALHPDGIPAKAYMKAVTFPNKGVVTTQNIDELRRIFNRKFPDKIVLLEHFIAIAMIDVEVVKIPEDAYVEEIAIRDVMDRPILRCAINEEVDYLLTGDKDFLESSVVRPRIITAREFLDI